MDQCGTRQTGILQVSMTQCSSFYVNSLAVWAAPLFQREKGNRTLSVFHVIVRKSLQLFISKILKSVRH